MESLTSRNFFTYRHGSHEIEGTSAAGLPISTQPCHEIYSYEELLSKISALNFYNPSLQIFFRGQDKDYYSNGKQGKTLAKQFVSISSKKPANEAIKKTRKNRGKDSKAYKS